MEITWSFEATAGRHREAYYQGESLPNPTDIINWGVPFYGPINAGGTTRFTKTRSYTARGRSTAFWGAEPAWFYDPSDNSRKTSDVQAPSATHNFVLSPAPPNTSKRPDDTSEDLFPGPGPGPLPEPGPKPDPGPEAPPERPDQGEAALTSEVIDPTSFISDSDRGSKPTRSDGYVVINKTDPADLGTVGSNDVNVELTHRIVTINSPAARDLKGTLKLDVEPGSIIGDYVVFHYDSTTGARRTITLPFQMPVTEPGHDGGDVHDFHAGYEQFSFRRIGDGALTLKVTVAPDNGAPFKTSKLHLLPVEVAVDADRDGEITFDGKDKTTAEKPFRFWINDDDDTFGEGNDTGGTLDRIPAVTPDHQNSFIDFIRDLEDFSRISFKLPDSFWSQIKAGEIQVGFKWSNTSGGNPAVNIFRQANQSGGQVQYFVDESEALDQAGTFTNAAQKVMTVSGSGTAYFPKSFIDRLPTNSAPTYVLFEGAAKGKGKLNLVLKVNGQEVVCDGPWIKLLDVRQFYSRGRTSLTATQISDPWDSPNPPAITSVADNTPEFFADPDETQQCIIHVHGWRMTEGDSRNWSEMTFKRLWQLHYKGRFATFRWATFSDDTHPPILGVDQSKLTYNRTEYRSWLCGPALAQFVNGLPYPGSRYLVAHSMGNVISGNALKAGMNVNRYVMCNAAMAAMSYDGSITNLPLSLVATPDTDSDQATRSLGLKNLFNDSLATRINYFLPKDEALAAWIVNQLANKPDHVKLYGYKPLNPPGEKLVQTTIHPLWPVFPNTDRIVTNYSEAMAHVTCSRSDAAGAVGYVGGSISSAVAMNACGFEEEHSAQWNWSLTSSYTFWRKLFESFQIPTTAP